MSLLGFDSEEGPRPPPFLTDPCGTPERAPHRRRQRAAAVPQPRSTPPRFPRRGQRAAALRTSASHAPQPGCTSSPPPACSISAPASQHTTQIPQKGSTGSGPEDQRAPRATTRLLWLPKLCYVLLCVCLAWRCSVLIRGCVTFYSVLVCFVVLSSVSLRH